MQPKSRQLRGDRMKNSKEVGVIISSRQAYETTEEVVASMYLADKVTIVQASKEESLDIAREMERTGYKVIVARGGTAELIMSEVKTPVVMISANHELIQSVYDARQLFDLDCPRIAILTFTGMSLDVDLFNRAFRVNLKAYLADGAVSDTVPVALARARREHDPHVVIGGLKCVKLAQEMGMKTIFLTSSFDSIKNALTEACKVLYAVKLEQTRARRMKILVDSISEGILYIDGEGIIQLVNPAAQRLLGKSAGQLLHQDAKKVIKIKELNTKLFHDGEAEVVEEIVHVGDSTLVVSVHPVGTESPEAMISLQETRKISHLDARIRNSLYAKGLTANYTFADIQGQSKIIRHTKKLAADFAATDSNILILGETGSGKELFAQSIHNASTYVQGPFVAVNCAALPPSLLESELFGYEEGAFTGANRKGKPGLIELSHGGTLFLDEISEMEQYGQVRLLRFIQERQVMRLGGSRYQSIHCRILAASNKNLRQLVAEGKFREDLYYRLKVLCLHVPPLRQRDEDVAHLIGKMADRWAQQMGREILFTREARKALNEYAWPGNVRELSNVVEFLSVASQGSPISINLVREALSDNDLYNAGGQTHVVALPLAVSDQNYLPADGPCEAERLAAALRRVNGNQSQAAVALGMHRSTLFRKMKKYGLVAEKT